MQWCENAQWFGLWVAIQEIPQTHRQLIRISCWMVRLSHSTLSTHKIISMFSDYFFLLTFFLFCLSLNVSVSAQCIKQQLGCCIFLFYEEISMSILIMWWNVNQVNFSIDWANNSCEAIYI